MLPDLGSREERTEVVVVATTNDSAMDDQAIRLLIGQKLQDGRLPHDRASRFWARPGAGQVCDVCESPITKNQMAVEGFASRNADSKPLQAHAACYQIWDAERRAPQSAASSPVKSH